MTTRYTPLISGCAFLLCVFSSQLAISQCTPVVVGSVPYLEDFDTQPILLTQSTADQLNWTLDANGTLSTGTGPTDDHTLGAGGGGFYYYFEATGPIVGDQAIMESPCINVSSLNTPYIEFWYNMNGAAMGTLALQINEGAGWYQVWSATGNQGTAWLQAGISLPGVASAIRYRFVGTCGSSFTSDMAFDDITVKEMPSGCNPQFTVDCSSGDYIDDVVFHTISNLNTGCSGTLPTNTTDYSATHSTTIAPNGVYSLQLQAAPGFAQYMAGLFDWNLDGDYDDAGEFYAFGQVAAGATSAQAITVPANATLGFSKMRIHTQYSAGLSQATYCNSTQWGEVEEYGITVASPDGAVQSLSSPVSECGMSANENVSITVANAGANTINSWNIRYRIDGGTIISQTIASTVAAGGTAALTFATQANFSTPGVYLLEVWTSLPGDPDLSNDTLSTYIVSFGTVSSFPYLENFDGTGGMLLQNPNEDFDWTVLAGGTTSGGTGPTADHTTGAGNYLYTEASVPRVAGDVAIMLSPCMDLTTMNDPYIEFWYHMYGATMGTLQVDGWNGSGWQSLWTATGDQGNFWQTQNISLAGFTNPDFLYRVAGTIGSSFTSDMAVDDIVVYDNATLDVGVSALLDLDAPSTCTADATQQVRIVLTNYGSGAASNFDATYVVNGIANTATYVLTLAPGASDTVVFPQTFDMSAIGYYDLEIYTQLAGDADLNNDTISTTILLGNVEAVMEIVTDDWGSEILWEIVDGVQPAQVGVGSGYANTTTYLDTVCLVQGNTYTVNAWDTYSDGWNGGTYSLTMCDGSVVLANNGGAVPTNGVTQAGAPVLEIEATENFTVGTCPGADITITSIDIADTLCGPVSESIVLTLQNIGVDPSTTIDITWQDALGSPITATYAVAIAPGASVQYTFASPYTWAIGNGTITAWVSAVGDIDLTNDTATQAVVRITQPTVSLGTAFSLCPGTTTTLSAGTGFDAYLWNTGAVTSSIMVSPGNSYSVTVTNGGYCSDNDAIAIGTLTVPTVSLGNDTAICPGTSLTIDAGAGFSGYLWSTGATTSSITGSGGNTYSVTVTSANTCTGSDAITVSTLTPPTVDLGSDQAACSGTTVTLDAGSGFTSYSWTGGTAMQTLDVTTGGTYSVTVTGANGCAATDAVVVTINSLPTVNLGPDVNVCSGASTTLDAGSGFSSYAWSNGSFAQTTSVSAAATYTVTVTDANGCSNTDDVVVTLLPVVTVGTGSTPAACGTADGSATATVSTGTAPYTYAWSNAGNTATISNVAAGVYSVTVTDANLCSGTATATVSNSGAPTVNATSTDLDCNGDADGTAAATATGGVMPYTYLWSNGGVTASLSGLSGGVYSVDVTDGSGCVAAAVVTVTEPSALTLSSTSTNATCGANDGTASVSASGGTSAYSYLWSSGQTGTSLTGLAPGSYTVTATDANGCTETATVGVSNIGAPTVTASVTNATCVGGTNGSATAMASAGTTPYTYSWSNGQTTATATGLAAGTYQVTVSGANGCSAIQSATITELFANPVVALGNDQTVCVGTPVVLNAGAGFTTYAWSNGGSSATNTVTTAGAVSVTVTDANGCSGSDGITVSNFTSPTVNLGTNQTVCPGSPATFDAGAGFAAYSWSNAAVTQTISVTTAGTYSVTVTDGNGCTASDAADLLTSTPMTLTTNSVDASCGASDGSAVVTVTSGSAPYTYAWSNGPTATINANLGAGVYTVVVTDVVGCTASIAVTINNVGGPTITNSISNDATCFGASNGSGLVTASGGTPPFTYAWSNGNTTSAANNLPAGVYTVNVTDAAGCVASTSITVGQPAQITLSTTGVDASCGNSDGSATVTVSGGSPAYSYLWNNVPASTTASASNLVAGTYSVTVTDAAGCSNNASVTVANVGAPTVNLSATPATCPGSTDGVGGASASGGQAPYTYQWNDANSQNTSIATGLTAGTYGVTVTDAAGCVTLGSIVIGTQLAGPVVDLGPDTSFCPGDAVVLDAGAGFSTYQWADNSTAQTLSVTSAGVYWVIVTNSSGCTGTDQVTVAEDTCVFVAPLAELAGWTAYPNPSHGLVYLRNDGSVVNNVAITVTNTMGAVVLQQRLEAALPGEAQAVQLDVAGGVYFVHIATGNRVTVQRIVIGDR